MSKRPDTCSTPTYLLENIKNQFRSLNGLRMTGSARQGATEIGFSDDDVIEAIQNLEASDFYKSMIPEKLGFTNLQDVYKSHFQNVELYIKFQKTKSGEYFMLISFKEK